MFKNVPEGFLMFHKVLKCPRMFQQNSRIFQNIPEDLIMFQKVLEYPGMFQQNSRIFQNVHVIKCETISIHFATKEVF